MPTRRTMPLPLRILVLAVMGLVLTACGQRVVLTVDEHPTDVAGVTEACAQVLDDAVDNGGRVDFIGLAADEEALDRALAGIAAVPLPTEPHARLAYLLNAYHLMAMKSVLVNGLPRSLEAYFDRAAVYGQTTFTVAGRWLTLEDVVDELIVPTHEPRVYAVLNGMVSSCPRLRRQAYRAAEIEDQLDAAMREFINDPRNLRFEPAGPTLVLSPLLRRYRDDLDADDAAPLALLHRYGIEPPAGCAVSYAPWDWRVIHQDPAAE